MAKGFDNGAGKMNIRSRLKKLTKRANIMAEPQPEEVAQAMMDFHENGGKWPAGTRPQVQERAERLMELSAAGMAIFD